MGVNWGYRGLYEGLQGVTRGYKRLQRVTMGYKGLKRVKGVDKGLTRGYRGLRRIIETFFYLKRSQILFLSLFSLKTTVEKISNF